MLTIDELTGIFSIKNEAGYFQVSQSKQKALSQAIAVVVGKKEPNQSSQPTPSGRG